METVNNVEIPETKLDLYNEQYAMNEFQSTKE